MATERDPMSSSQSEGTPDQFIIHIKNCLAKCLELSGSSSRDFDALVELIVKEQLTNSYSEELAVYLLERGNEAAFDDFYFKVRSYPIQTSL